MIYAGLGEKDKAFEKLNQAAEERSTLLVYLRKDPRVEILRSDPRFQALPNREGAPRVKGQSVGALRAIVDRSSTSQ